MRKNLLIGALGKRTKSHTIEFYLEKGKLRFEKKSFWLGHPRLLIQFDCYGENYYFLVSTNRILELAIALLEFCHKRIGNPQAIIFTQNFQFETSDEKVGRKEELLACLKLFKFLSSSFCLIAVGT